MTAIVGIAQEGRVWMGCDSASVSDWTMQADRGPKIFKTGPLLVGFTASWRVGQVAQYGDLTSHIRDAKYPEPLEFMVTSIIPRLRTILKNAGAAEHKDGIESGGTFLIGFRGRLFRVCYDYGVGEAIQGYDAIGVGDQICLGSLHTSEMHRPVLAPEARISLALLAAVDHSAGVCLPTRILHLERDE